VQILILRIDSDPVGRSTIFILVSGISVFWHFNGSDFVAACKYKTASGPIVHSIVDLSGLCALRYQPASLCLVVLWLENLQKDEDRAYLSNYRVWLSI
jgi:hypothetical protein